MGRSEEAERAAVSQLLKLSLVKPVQAMECFFLLGELRTRGERPTATVLDLLLEKNYISRDAYLLSRGRTEAPPGPASDQAALEFDENERFAIAQLMERGMVARKRVEAVLLDLGDRIREGGRPGFALLDILLERGHIDATTHAFGRRLIEAPPIEESSATSSPAAPHLSEGERFAAAQLRELGMVEEDPVRECCLDLERLRSKGERPEATVIELLFEKGRIDSLGYARFRKGDLQEALEDLSRAIGWEPRRAEAYAHRGMVQAVLAQRSSIESRRLLDQARKDLQQALQLGGDRWPQKEAVAGWIEQVGRLQAELTNP